MYAKILVSFFAKFLSNFEEKKLNRNLDEIFAISRNTKSKFGQHFCYFEKRDRFFITTKFFGHIINHIEMDITGKFM